MLNKVRALTADEVTIILDTLDVAAADLHSGHDSDVYNMARRRALREAHHIVLAVCEQSAEGGNND